MAGPRPRKTGCSVGEEDYVIRVLNSPLEIPSSQWNALLHTQTQPNPFLRHEYLAALHRSGCAVPKTGWTARFLTLWRPAANSEATGLQLCGACALYRKSHSHGEYVFDWAWAKAYANHGLAYYPKALAAVPFTPVPGTRLMAIDAPARKALLQALLQACVDDGLSSLHLLFVSDEDAAACTQAGLMLRHSVQFHWNNVTPLRSSLALDPGLVASRTTLDRQSPQATALRPVLTGAGRSGAAGLSPTGAIFPSGGPSEKWLAPTRPTQAGRPFCDFDEFLAALSQDKRKKIRQERRKVRDAAVDIRCCRGTEISEQDWDFFYRCYERTYLEHGNAPYLNRSFFQAMADTMAENWLLFVAQRDGTPIACSLIGLSNALDGAPQVAYGRYWGALERVDCLHFELCYYQPLAWCIAHGVRRFEGGAQGEHKMARALLPVKTSSAHWLAHPAFADAVQRFLDREGQGIEGYLQDLEQRSPLRRDVAGLAARRTLGVGAQSPTGREGQKILGKQRRR